MVEEKSGLERGGNVEPEFRPAGFNRGEIGCVLTDQDVIGNRCLHSLHDLAAQHGPLSHVQRERVSTVRRTAEQLEIE